MCGIYGMVSPVGKTLRHPEHQDAMRRSLAHRGPDGHGCVSVPHAVMGVNRLRIIDRRSQADQPFSDPSGVWLAVNGEIYNAPDLRGRFPDYPYRSMTDVEPILPLYLTGGPGALADLDGMFAIAIWDERNRTLTLARDRAGEKPLFITQRDGEIWFGSEIQSLLNGVRPPVDRAAFADFVRLGYVLEPRTMWEGISRVESGTITTFSTDGRKTVRYWDPLCGVRSAERGVRTDPASQLSELLQTAVRKQLVADVPVGVFASGGLDSSLVVALASKEIGGESLHTFSVRFPDSSYDEGPFARRVSGHFGTRHVEAMATEPALTAALESVTTSLAEPIADPAMLPSLILSRTARENAGVVLSGEGADELFGGYPTYLGHKVAPWFNRLPGRRFLARVIERLPSSYGRVPVEFLLKRFVAGAELPWFERHMAWFGTGLPAEILAGQAAGRIDGWTDRRMDQSEGGSSAYPSIRLSDEVLNKAMLWDYQSYLRDRMLVKNDRATSLVALESRAPYLDAEVTRFAFSLPTSQKVRGFTTKRLLRQVARRWLPPEIVNRRKRGLSVPTASLLNGSLTASVDRVLAPGRLARQGLLNPRTVSELVAGHRRGHLALSRGLWTLFVLELWMEHWMPEATG